MQNFPQAAGGTGAARDIAAKKIGLSGVTAEKGAESYLASGNFTGIEASILYQCFDRLW